MRRHVGSVSLLAITSGILAVWLTAPSAALAQTRSPLYWNTASGTGVLWSNAANWWTTPTGTVSSSAPGSLNDAIFDGSSVSGPTIVQLSAAAAADGLYFNNNSTGTVLLESSSSTPETLSIGTDGVTVEPAAGAVTLGDPSNVNLMPISITGSQAWTNETTNVLNVYSAISTTATSTLTFAGPGGANLSGAVSNGTGALALTMSGTGTVTLSGANTYTGATTISSGTMQFNNEVSLYNDTTASWTAANIVVGSGATLAFNVGGSGQFTTGDVTTLLANLDGSVTTGGLQAGSTIGFDTTNAVGETFTIANTIANTTGTGGGAVGLTILGTNTLVLAGANTYTGATTISAGTLSLTGTLGGGVNGGTAISSAATFTESSAGVIAGSSSLSVTAGTTTLGGANTYTGATTISGGTLNLTGTIGGGASGTAISSAATFTESSAGVIAGSSSLSVTAGTTTLAGANTYTGPTTTSAGTLGLTGSLTASSITTSGTGVFSESSTGAVGGAASFTQGGSGASTLAGTNTYTGTTTISGGTLQFTNEVSLYNDTTASWTAANIIVKSGATLAFNVGGTGQFTSGDLATLLGLGTGSGGFESGSFVGLDTTNAAGGNFAYSAAIANPNSGTNTLGLTKLGSNTLTLSAANTYNGATTISAGTLSLTGTLGSGGGTAITSAATFSESSAGIIAGTSSLTVTAGTTTLAGANTYNGATTTTSGGTLNLTGTIGGGASGTAITSAGTFTESSAGVIVGTSSLTVTGGTTTLSGANTYTVNTSVNLGTLALTPATATPVINSVANSSALALGGGSLTMTGAASVNAFQQFPSTAVSAGSSSISATDGASGGNFDVTLGAITRTAGAAVSFTLPAGTPSLAVNGIATTTTDPTATNTGILGGYATVGGNWAVSGATAGSISSWTTSTITFNAIQTAGNEVVFTSGTIPTGLSLNKPYYILTSSATSGVSATQGGTAITLSGTSTSGAVVDSAGNISALGTYTTLTASGGGTLGTTNFSLATALPLNASSPITANSLNITDTTPADALALGANSATFNGASGGLLYAGGSNYSITGTGTIGSGSSNEFIVTTTGSGTLTISAPLSTTSVTKAGTGTLILEPATGYTGATTVAGGTLDLVNPSNYGNTNLEIGKTAISVSSGATFAALAGIGTITSGPGSGSTGASLTLNAGSTYNMVDGQIGEFKIIKGTGNIATSTNLTLSGATLNFDIGVAGTDLLFSNSMASISGTNTINLTPFGGILPVSGGSPLQYVSSEGGPFFIIQANDGFSGSGTFQFSNGKQTENMTVGGVTYTLALNQVPVSIIGANATAETVTVTSQAPTLTWTGAALNPSGVGNGTPTLWDIGTTMNWSTSPTSNVPAAYSDGNAVVFGDIPGTGGNQYVNYRYITIQPAGVTPSAVCFTGSYANYQIDAGSGPIMGATTTLTSNCTLSTVILNSNTYGGGTWIASGGTPGLGGGGITISTSTTVVSGAITSGPLGTGTITFAGGSLSNYPINLTPDSIILANNIVISANAVVAATGGGTITFDGTNLTVPATVTLSNTPLVSAGADATIINDVVTGNSGLTAGSGQLFLNGANTYTGITTVTATSGSDVLSVSILANGGSPSGIGESSNAAASLVLLGGTLQYLGSGGTTNRLFTLGTSGGSNTGGTLDASGTGPIVWSNTGAIVSNSGSTYYPLTLTGTNTGNNILTPILTGTSTLTKSEAGTWILAGSNTFTGSTTISGGILAVTGTGQLYYNGTTGITNASSTITVSGGGTLEVDRWDEGGASPDLSTGGSGSFGNLEGQAAQLVINGGTIMYTGNTNYHDTNSTDSRAFTIGASGATLDAATAGQTWNINANSTTSFDIASTASGLLTLDGAGNGQIYQAIPGTGGLTMSGPGTWTLNAANTYSGPTAINAGTLVAGNTNALQKTAVTLNVLNNGLQFTANLGSASLGSLAGSGNIVLQDNAVSPAAIALSVGSNNGTTAYSGSLSGPGSLAMVGTGAFTLSGASSYTGATSVSTSTGTLKLASSASLGNTAISVASGATLAPQAGSVTITAGSTGTAGAGASLSLASGAIFNMEDGAIGTFQLQQGSGFSPNALTLAGATLDFDLNGSVGALEVPAVDLLAAGGKASVSGTNTINLNLLTPSVLNPGGPINLITAASGLTGTFQFSNASTTENMTVGGIPLQLTLTNSPTAETLTIVSTASTLTWTGQANGTGAAASTWDVGTSTNWANSSNSADTYGTGDTAVFNDTNAVTGSPVTNGTVNIMPGGVTPTAVQFNNSSVAYTISNSSGPIEGAATLSKSGSALLSIQNSNNTYARGTTVTAGTLQISASTTVVSNAITQGPLGTGTVSLSGGTFDNGSASQVTLANSVAITANSTLSSSGGGTLVFDGTNLTTPATVVLSNNPTLTVNNTTTINDVISGSGQSLTLAGSGTLILGGTNTYPGTTTISSGTLQLGNGTTNGSVAGSITDDSALVFATTGSPSYATAISGSGSVTVNGTGSGTLTLSGGNSFQGGLTILGNGILTLSGANTYSGGTLIQSGTLRAGAVNTLPTTATVTFGGPGSATGMLDLNGYGLTVGGLVVASGASTNAANQIITNSNTSGHGTTATLTYNGGNSFFAGTLQDGSGGNLLALTVAGGNLTLSGANTYTGATAVNGGSLQVASPGSLASAVTINSGGVLSGSGAIGGLVTVNSGGVLAPSGVASAATPMTLNGGLTLANGAVLDFNLTTPGSGDSVNVSGGSLSLGTTGGVLNINEFGGGGELEATSYPLIYDPSITGNAAAWTVGDHVGDTGHTYSFTDTGGQFDLVVSIAGTSGTWKSNGLGSASYGDPGNWSSGTPGTIPNGVGVIATFGTGSTVKIKLDGTPNGPNFVVGGLVFNNAGFSYVLGSDGIGSLTLNNSGGGASVVATNAPYSTIGTTLTLADSSLTTTFNIDSASYLDVEGPINESTPTGQQIVLTGGGYLQLDGINSYTGGTTVSNGVLTVGLNGTGTLGSGPLAINAAGTTSIVNLSNNISVGGLSATVSGGGSAQLNVASGATLTVNQTGTGVFAGTLSLSASGSGGGLTVGSGTVQLNVASASALGSGVTATVASGATLQLTGAVSALSDPNSGNLANVLTLGTGSASDGALQVTGATTQTVGVVSGQALSSSPTTYSGNTTVGDGTNAANLTATQILQNTLTINAGSTVTIAPSGSGISTDAVPATSAVATSDVATGAASTADDSTTDPFTAIEAAIASGSISSAKGQQLENRIAAIERLAATDPGLDVSLLEDRVLAALPSTSVWTSATSPLAEPGSSLLAVDSGNSASSSDAALSSAAAFAPAADFGGSPAAVPEPSSLLLATMAGIGILIAVHRRTTNCES